MTRNRILFAVAAIAAAAAVGNGAAQGPPSFELSFSNPGARSLGFGGAFAALADDATAAFANPAGLVQLTRPEISLEGRSWRYDIPYTAGGRVSGQPTGIGLDSTPGLRTEVSSQDVAGLSFLSYVYPGKRWSFALYRHQLANFEFRSQTQGLFGEAPPDSPCCVERILDQRNAVDLEIVSHAVAVAFQVTEDLSVGIGLSRFGASAPLTTEWYAVDDPTSVESFFGESSYLPERLESVNDFAVEDSDLGLAAGVLWRLSQRFSLGGFFRAGPGFEFRGQARAGPEHEFGLPDGTVILEGNFPVDFPDVWGLGVGFRSRNDRLTLAFEWDRVEYSTILESLKREVPGVTQRIDDADELHLGGEWVFVGVRPLLAVRLGVWHDPDHRSREEGDDPVDRALFRGGEDELHVAVGFGVVFRDFHVDLAFDFSDLVDTASVSAIYSF